VFQALTSDGETFEAHMTLAQAKLDGEPCTQINIATSPKGGSATGGSSTVDAATGLFNRHYMGEQGAALVAQKVKASFLLLQLDEYRKLLADVHVSGIDALIKDLVLQIEKAIPGDKTVGRFGDNSVAIILPLLPEAALEKAKALLKAVESHICELDGRTVQYTCTCAIQALAGKSAEIIDNAMDALLSVREDVGKNKAQVVSAMAKPVAATSSSGGGGIESALEAGLFRLLYQPMMSLQGDEMENYESTIWMVDGTNLTSPDALAKGAKNSKLDRWIVIEATKALSMHQAKGHKTRLVINLTAVPLPMMASFPGWAWRPRRPTSPTRCWPSSSRRKTYATTSNRPSRSLPPCGLPSSAYRSPASARSQSPSSCSNTCSLT
jgi:GGDEF domain-containing protein